MWASGKTTPDSILKLCRTNSWRSGIGAAALVGDWLNARTLAEKASSRTRRRMFRGYAESTIDGNAGSSRDAQDRYADILRGKIHASLLCGDGDRRVCQWFAACAAGRVAIEGDGIAGE